MDLRESTVCRSPVNINRRRTKPMPGKNLPSLREEMIKTRSSINHNNNNDSSLATSNYYKLTTTNDCLSESCELEINNSKDDFHGQPEADRTRHIICDGDTDRSTLRNNIVRIQDKSATQQLDSYNDLNNLTSNGISQVLTGSSQDHRIASEEQRDVTTAQKLTKRMRRVDRIDSKLVVAPSKNTTEDGEPICSCGARISSQQQNYGSPITNIPKRTLSPPHKLVSLGERNGRSICNKHMPWFGIDVGGSLVKVVFFDPKDATREETVTLKRIRRYLKSSKAYGTTGKRDAHLEMPNCVINKRLGSLHFIRFASNQMPEFLAMAKNKRFTDTINTVCATGGGAYKFEEDIKNNLGITLHKTDELDSIIHGIHYIDKYNSERECYFLEDPLDESKCVKVPYDFSRPYPYLVVNIGSGVSILAVYSSTFYSRISGSSIGGGTFLGLCCLLTQCKTFDEAIKLARAGSSAKIDKLVKDIYGGDYPKFNLTGDTVASSFGHMNMAEKRKDVKREDLARALLEMVTINIGSIARMCAANENIDRVVFIGNFLRVNQLSMKLLSYAVNYWSKGAIKALFLEHEGYFGAVGCFVESTQGCHHQ